MLDHDNDSTHVARKSWLHELSETSGLPAVTLTKCMKYKKETFAYLDTLFWYRISSKIWTIREFQVLNPHKWPWAKRVYNRKHWNVSFEQQIT